MSKRRHARFVRRLETEFSASGMNYRAISSDFSCSGLFIRTNHAFPPDTILEVVVYLPDGTASRLKGRVCRALKTNVVSLKNGMGIELIEKDQHYRDFMQTFTKECDDKQWKAPPDLSPIDTSTDAPKESAASADPVFIPCPVCGVKNKVRTERLSQGPKCGKCGAQLSAT